MSEKSIKLTKKQQKAVAFRTKKKVKSIQEEPSPFPEVDEVDHHQSNSTKQKSDNSTNSNKRKREENSSNSKTNKSNEQEDEIIGVAAKRRKRKKAAQVKKYEEEKLKKSSKLILFVGNLPFDMTSEKLKSFFLEHCEEEPEVRLMTHKSTNNNETLKPVNMTKGCGFVEFKSSGALQKALRLHHTPMNSESKGEENQKKSRKINIELTAGGGGKSENRLKKIEHSKERLNKQRDKRIEKNLKQITEKRLKYGLEALEPGEEDVTVKFGNKKKSEEFTLEEGKANWGSKSNSGTSGFNHPSKPSRFKGRPQSSGANSIRLT